jgi:outer membrane lipoprotein-sorting protein
MHMRIFLPFLAFILLFAPFSAKADDAADIAKAVEYLNNLGTAQARFVQTAHNGAQLLGTFYLNRPGRLRFQYDPPIEDFVVADGTFIYFYDSELKEQSNAPIGQTLADFFLRDNITLDQDIIVKDVRRGGDLLQIELVQSTDPDAGSILLGFRENPFHLKKWRITDAQDLITEIELFYLKTDIELDKSLFTYVDPSHGQTPSYND